MEESGSLRRDSLNCFTSLRVQSEAASMSGLLSGLLSSADSEFTWFGSMMIFLLPSEECNPLGKLKSFENPECSDDEVVGS